MVKNGWPIIRGDCLRDDQCQVNVFSGTGAPTVEGYDPRLQSRCRIHADLNPHVQYVLSKLRYWIASAMCLGSSWDTSSISAIVRATFRMRSWARALRPCW